MPANAHRLTAFARAGHAPDFRDQLLIRYPGLLNGLLERANSSKHDFNDLADLCVLLLSRPLPDAVPLPAAAQTFLLHVFEKASHSPNPHSLKSVYCMLNGACGQLHRLLPSSARRRFDTELCRILQNNVSGESAMLLLWLCGIVMIVEHPEGLQRIHASNASEQPVSTQTLTRQWLTPSGQKLFGSTKDLYKNMQMTCLNVLWLLKAHGDEDDAAHGLRIASRIMQCIDNDIRDSWLKHEKGAALFEKCRSRIEEADVSPTTHLEALSFFGQLSSSRTLPQSMVKRYSSCLFGAVCTAEPDSISELLSVSLPRFAEHIQDIEELFAGVLDACAEQPSPKHMSNLIRFADELTTATLSSETLRSTVLHGLSSKTIQDKIWHLVRLNPKTQATSCYAHVASLHRQLIAATIASILTITLAAEPGDPTLPHALTAALVKAQRDLPLVGGACLHPSGTTKDSSISLFQAANTQNTGQHLEDWSARLGSELESQGRYQRDAILRSVTQICSDLETRCNTVEEPLRREKERSSELEEKICHLTDDLESMRIQNEDSVEQLEGLEKELEDAREDMDRLRQEKERVYSRVQDLESVLEESNLGANEALSAAREAFSAKELVLQSTILQYEEDCRNRDLEIQQLQDTLSELTQSKAQWERDHKTLAREHELLQHRCNDAEEMLGQERAHVSQQNDDIARLEILVSEYQNQFEEKEAQLAELFEELDAARSAHDELQEASDARVRDLAAQHASDIEAVNARADLDCKTLEDQLQDALQDYERERGENEKSRGKIDHLQQAIPPLESRIQELEDFCKEQEEELEERRAIHRNVLAHFGVSSQQPLAVRSASRSYKDIAAEPTTREPRTQRRRKSAFIAPDTTPQATESDLAAPTPATESKSNASSESSSSQTRAPIPKRSRPRSAFKVPTMHTPYTQKPNLISRSASGRISPSKRSALRQMSPNRRHTVGFSTAEQEKDDYTTESAPAGTQSESLADIDQTDEFDTDDELFSGTPLTPGFMTGTGRVPDEDETTAVTL